MTDTWPAAVTEARAVQERMRDPVVTSGAPGPIRRVAGIDVHVAPAAGLTWASVAVVTMPELELVESALAAVPTGFPYVPGYLSFREAPAALAALTMLRCPLMIEGHGIAHPRRLGIATHLGVITGLPTIGVAKSRLVGRHEEPGPAKGERVPLVDRGEVVGTVLRSREGGRPCSSRPVT